MVVERGFLARAQERDKEWSAGKGPDDPLLSTPTHLPQETPSLPSPETVQYCCANNGLFSCRFRDKTYLPKGSTTCPALA